MTGQNPLRAKRFKMARLNSTPNVDLKRESERIAKRQKEIAENFQRTRDCETLGQFLPNLLPSTSHETSSSPPAIKDFTFFNQALQTLSLLRNTELRSATPVVEYVLEKENEIKQVNSVVKVFMEDLKRAKKDQLCYWFILESPFHSVSNKTFAKGHAVVSRLPHDFRIRYLPDVLRKCSLEKFDIMHVVLNATYNWINEFDTNKVEIKTEYRELMGDLFGIFANCGIKRTIILTTPIFEPGFKNAVDNLHKEVHQQVLEFRKQKFSVYFVDYEQCLSNETLKHGTEKFRKALEKINDYFVAEH